MSTLIELDGIEFAYPGRPPLLTGAALALESGERTPTAKLAV